MATINAAIENANFCISADQILKTTISNTTLTKLLMTFILERLLSAYLCLIRLMTKNLINSTPTKKHTVMTNLLAIKDKNKG